VLFGLAAVASAAAAAVCRAGSHGSAGLRITRAFDSTVLHEASEADAGSGVVLVLLPVGTKQVCGD
jgi:hypothetical protein